MSTELQNEVNEQETVFSFFRTHPVMTIGTLSEEDKPQLAAVYVHVDETDTFYCTTRDTTRKFKNMLRTPVVSLFTYDETLLRCGEIEGRAKLVHDAELVAEILPKLQSIARGHGGSYWVPPVAQIEGFGYVFFKITPTVLLYNDYGQSQEKNIDPITIKLTF